MIQDNRIKVKSENVKIKLQSRGGRKMAAELSDQVFTIVDEMYNHLKQQQTDPDILATLMKAAQALNKKMPAQIVAVKTVNGITLCALNKKLSFDEITNQKISELKTISRMKGYQWSATGIGDLRIQF